MVEWKRLGEENYAYDWAIETCSAMKNYMLKGDHKSLIDYPALSTGFRLSTRLLNIFCLCFMFSLFRKKGKN